MTKITLFNGIIRIMIFKLIVLYQSICLFDLLQVVLAEHSSQKVRIHKNFIKDIMDKNFAGILQHIESQIDKNVLLTEINA